jgi:hypothetical protein
VGKQAIGLEEHASPGAGVLRVLDRLDRLPFPVARIFTILDVPSPDVIRAAHAHKACRQFLVALVGSFRVTFHDGRSLMVERTLRPDRPGIYVPPMTWLVVCKFSRDAVCLVLCSDAYDPGDYIRDFDEFLRIRRNGDPGRKRK